MLRVTRCPECGHVIEDPDHMDGLELRAIVGEVGVAKGYGGPMPLNKFARLCKIGPRALSYYLSGERPTPPLVAAQARRLRDTVRRDPAALVLPKRWEEQRRRVLRRKRAIEQARARRQASGEPPF